MFDGASESQDVWRSLKMSKTDKLSWKHKVNVAPPPCLKWTLHLELVLCVCTSSRRNGQCVFISTWSFSSLHVVTSLFCLIFLYNAYCLFLSFCFSSCNIVLLYSAHQLTNNAQRSVVITSQCSSSCAESTLAQQIFSFFRQVKVMNTLRNVLCLSFEVNNILV